MDQPLEAYTLTHALDHFVTIHNWFEELTDLVVAIWKQGVRFDRESYRERLGTDPERQ